MPSLVVAVLCSVAVWWVCVDVEEVLVAAAFASASECVSGEARLSIRSSDAGEDEQREGGTDRVPRLDSPDERRRQWG